MSVSAPPPSGPCGGGASPSSPPLPAGGPEGGVSCQGCTAPGWHQSHPAVPGAGRQGRGKMETRDRRETKNKDGKGISYLKSFGLILVKIQWFSYYCMYSGSGLVSDICSNLLCILVIVLFEVPEVVYSVFWYSSGLMTSSHFTCCSVPASSWTSSSCLRSCDITPRRSLAMSSVMLICRS